MTKRFYLTAVFLVILVGAPIGYYSAKRIARADASPIAITDTTDALEMSDIQLKGEKHIREMQLLQERLKTLRSKYHVPDDYIEDAKTPGGAVIGWKPPDKKQ